MEDPKVRALAVSHVQFHNGYRVDLDRLSAGARATGTWLVVDSIQALGQVPFDVRRTPVDILSCGGQKWLLSPGGPGSSTSVATGSASWCLPLEDGAHSWGPKISPRSAITVADPAYDARRFELVTLPFQDLLGCPIRWTCSMRWGGTDSGAPRQHRRTAPGLGPGPGIAAGLAGRPERLRNDLPRCGRLPGGIAALKRAGITASLREGALRFAPHCYNTIEEMARVVEVLDPTFS